MAGLGLLCDFCFIKYISKTGYLCWMPQTISQGQMRLKVINQSIHIIQAYLEHHGSRLDNLIVNLKPIKLEGI